MEIKKGGTQPSQKGPAEHFTGNVRLDPLFTQPAPARVSGAYVTFEPCARSDWHTHPLGQTLIVTFGCGLHQRWGGPIEQIRPGDVITVGPNEKHWHGAEDPRVDGRDRTPLGDVHLRVRSVALPRNQPDEGAYADRPRVLRHRR